MSRTPSPEDRPLDPDELEQRRSLDPEDEDGRAEDADRPLSPDEQEQRIEVDYADDEY